ncbi:MAG: ATP-dependent Clp protease ATP-binding subunit [Candidatus Saganbacteria bacterium]|nr:ATP-dependent Clp protease ATP-binding subunit [Candidatus Saganbacteria bacterium]
MKINFINRFNPGIQFRSRVMMADSPGTSSTRPPFLKDMRVEKRWESLPVVVEREQDLIDTINALIQEDKNSVVYVGEPGVGKTALMYELGRKIVNGEVPPLRDRKLLLCDMAELEKGPLLPGESEKRLLALQSYLDNMPGKALIFVDEIQRLFRMKGASGKAVDNLKEALASDRLTLVGTTTSKDFLATIEIDSALQRRLNIIELAEMSADSSMVVLYSSNDKREKYYSREAGKPLTIPDSVLEEGVRLADEHIKARYFPDKALDVIKKACSIRVNEITTTRLLLESMIGRVRIQFAKALRAIKNDEPKQTVAAKKELVTLAAEYYSLRHQLEELEGGEKIVITRDDLLAAVSNISKIPLAKLKEDEKEKLLKLEDILSRRVIGQGDAKKAVAAAVRRGRTLKTPGKPQGVLLFLGQTGIGKTELAKTLAEALFGDEKFLLRYDMTEYQEQHSVARWIGAPPGYVGHGQGGGIVEAVNKQPYSVILLDEIEKAHENLKRLCLQIFDDAKLTDGRGKTADFSNTIIIMTSNLAAKEIQEMLRKVKDPERRAKLSVAAFKKGAEMEFAPEFVNRITNIIPFASLSPKDLKRILDLQINGLARQISTEFGCELELTQPACELLLSIGYVPKYGARPLKRALTDILIDPLVEKIIAGDLPPRSMIKVDQDFEHLDRLTFERTGEVMRPEFHAPQVEGRVGILVHRLLSLIELKASKGQTRVQRDEVEEILFPKDEKVQEALNSVVAAGILPTGNIRLSDNDYRKKDALVMDLYSKLSQLAEIAGFAEGTGEAAADFVYFLSAYAKMGNVLPRIFWDFDGEKLTLSIRTSKLAGNSSIKQRLQDNLTGPTPFSLKQSKEMFDILGREGDLNLLELKRKIRAVKGIVGFEDENSETVFFAQFGLFKDTEVHHSVQGQASEEEVVVGAKPARPQGRKPDFERAWEEGTDEPPPKGAFAEPGAGTGLVPPRAATTEWEPSEEVRKAVLGREETKEVLLPDGVRRCLNILNLDGQLLNEKDELHLTTAPLDEQQMESAFSILKSVFTYPEGPLGVKIQALRVYVALKGAKNVGPEVREFFKNWGNRAFGPQFEIILKEENSQELARAIILTVFGDALSQRDIWKKYSQDVFWQVMNHGSEEQKKRIAKSVWKLKSSRDLDISVRNVKYKKTLEEPGRLAGSLKEYLTPEGYLGSDLSLDDIWRRPGVNRGKKYIEAKAPRVSLTRARGKKKQLRTLMNVLSYRIDEGGLDFLFQPRDILEAWSKIWEIAKEIGPGARPIILEYLHSFRNLGLVTEEAMPGKKSYNEEIIRKCLSSCMGIFMESEGVGEFERLLNEFVNILRQSHSEAQGEGRELLESLIESREGLFMSPLTSDKNRNLGPRRSD